jgi:hypothetical protein
VDDGGGMDDDARTGAGRGERPLVVERARTAGHGQPGECPVDDRPRSADEDADGTAAIDELTNDVVSDETGRAGHEAVGGVGQRRGEQW